MGLSASQARLLLLYAQKSDLEFRGQQINHRRLIISTQLAESAKEYSTALSNTTIEIVIGAITDDGQDMVKQFDTNDARFLLPNMGWFIVDSNDDRISDEDLETLGDREFRQLLKAGLMHVATTDEFGEQQRVDWRTNSAFRQVLDVSDDEVATAQYESDGARLQSLDKELELELKNIDTKHKAIETETDAVKKIIDKNIEKSFKTFA